MYVIIAYDVSVEHVNKVKAYLRTQLTWVQNSLFEGELTDSRFLEVKERLTKIIKPEKDSITIYIVQSKGMIERQDIGVKKGDPTENVL